MDTEIKKEETRSESVFDSVNHAADVILKAEDEPHLEMKKVLLLESIAVSLRGIDLKAACFMLDVRVAKEQVIKRIESMWVDTEKTLTSLVSAYTHGNDTSSNKTH